MKIALMSFAHTHALGYARLLSRMPDVEVMASDPRYLDRGDPEGSGGAAQAEALGVSYAETYDQLFAWGPEAVVVCSENANHRDDVLRAAASGAHVLCEKPIATSLEDADKMIRACESAGVNLMIAFPVRFSPAFAVLKARFDSGALGNVYAISGTNNGQVPLGRAWFTDPVLSGGGALTDHVVHIADLLDTLFGEVAASSVYAVSNRILRPDLEAETAGLVSITYDNGVIATIDCSWSRPAHYPTWGGLTLQISAEAGLMDIDAFGQRVEGFSETSANALWLPYGPDSNARMLDEFIQSIRTGKTAKPDGAAGYRTAQVVQAAYESLRTGRPARLR